jgi:hypothetical protein
MKTIIAGSRSIVKYDIVKEYIVKANFNITEVVCGMAKGVDLLGKEYAEENDIPIKEFPANWDLYGKRAGHLRNTEMAKYADALIAIWDGKSPGTKNMIDEAYKYKLKVFIEIDSWLV